MFTGAGRRGVRAAAQRVSSGHGSSGGAGSNFWAKAATGAGIASCVMQAVDSPRINEAVTFLGKTIDQGAKARAGFLKDNESAGPGLK